MVKKIFSTGDIIYDKETVPQKTMFIEEYDENNFIMTIKCFFCEKEVGSTKLNYGLETDPLSIPSEEELRKHIVPFYLFYIKKWL